MSRSLAKGKTTNWPIWPFTQEDNDNAPRLYRKALSIHERIGASDSDKIGRIEGNIRVTSRRRCAPWHTLDRDYIEENIADSKAARGEVLTRYPPRLSSPGTCP
jgi:hypothetical protein